MSREEEARKKLVALMAEAELDRVLDETEKLTPEERAKEDAAAGYDAKADVAAKRKMLEAALRGQEGGGAKVVPLAPKRRINWNMVAMAAVFLLVLGVLWRLAKSGGGDDIPVAAPLCVTPKPGEPLEGTLRREGESFLVDAKYPVCGPDRHHPQDVVELAAKVDLAPFDGKSVRVEGKARFREGPRPVIVDVERIQAADAD